MNAIYEMSRIASHADVLGASSLPHPRRRVLNKFYTGRLRPEVQPRTLYTIFHGKGIPFVHLLLIDKWYPFHIPCLELCIPFNCCNCTVV